MVCDCFLARDALILGLRWCAQSIRSVPLSEQGALDEPNRPTESKVMPKVIQSSLSTKWDTPDRLRTSGKLETGIDSQRQPSDNQIQPATV